MGKIEMTTEHLWQLRLEGRIAGYLRWRPGRWQGSLDITRVHPPHPVQEITEDDALAEGIEEIGEMRANGRLTTEYRSYEKDTRCTSAVAAYSTLWDFLNGKRPGCSWDYNHWVWPIETRLLERRPE